MSKILMPVTPLAGHVNPMLAIAAYLHRQGHEVLFTTSELFRERVEACELRFIPLIGNANYDYRQLGELIPGVRTAVSHIDLYNIYAKRLLGDCIPDQYRGVRQILDNEDIDLVITEAGFGGYYRFCCEQNSDHLCSPAVQSLRCGMIQLSLS